MKDYSIQVLTMASNLTEDFIIHSNVAGQTWMTTEQRELLNAMDIATYQAENISKYTWTLDQYSRLFGKGSVAKEMTNEFWKDIESCLEELITSLFEVSEINPCWKRFGWKKLEEVFNNRF